MPISCVIITYNEEINIKRCLESISWCDDIHIIDSGSSDATVEIASKFNCKIIEKSFSNFADQRNFAIEKCELKYKWILHLDADEVVTSELRDFFLSRSYEKMAFKAYKIPFKLIFNGRWLKRAGMYPAYQVRFGYLDKLSYKMEGHGQKETLSTEEIGTITQPLEHYNFSKGLAPWFQKHVMYAHSEAKDSLKLKESFRWRILFFAVLRLDNYLLRRQIKALSFFMPFRPILRYSAILFFRLGFLDGKAGFMYAKMMCIYQSMIDVLIEEERSKNRL